MKEIIKEKYIGREDISAKLHEEFVKYAHEPERKGSANTIDGPGHYSNSNEIYNFVGDIKLVVSTRRSGDVIESDTLVSAVLGYSDVDELEDVQFVQKTLIDILGLELVED